MRTVFDQARIVLNTSKSRFRFATRLGSLSTRHSARHWYGGDAFATHFPERPFIDFSLRRGLLRSFRAARYREQIDDAWN